MNSKMELAVGSIFDQPKVIAAQFRPENDAMVICEDTLTNLQRGVEHDFEVVATNPPGDSIPSNVVTVVL